MKDGIIALTGSEDEEVSMNEEQANTIARALGGETWQSGGDLWLVLINRADGRLVVISDEAIVEYENQEAFDDAKPATSIMLC